jgi:hypothetical protein
VIPHGNELIELTYHATAMRRMEGKRQRFRLVQLMLNLFFYLQKNEGQFHSTKQTFFIPFSCMQSTEKGKRNGARGEVVRSAKGIMSRGCTNAGPAPYIGS